MMLCGDVSPMTHKNVLRSVDGYVNQCLDMLAGVLQCVGALRVEALAAEVESSTSATDSEGAELMELSLVTLA